MQRFAAPPIVDRSIADSSPSLAMAAAMSSSRNPNGGLQVNTSLSVLAGLAATLMLASAAPAQTAKPASPAAGQPSAATVAQLQKTLKARLPQITIEKVQPSQWPFLYEVITKEELFYVDATGDFLFYGKVMDTKTREDLTDKRWNDLIKVEFGSLPFELAFKRVKGNGSRKLAVFADPDCPYCVRFEKTLEQVDNVTVYTFLYPLESLHPGAVERSRQIWCAKDRDSTWLKWMNSKDTPPRVANCNSEAVDKLIKLGEKLKVSGTPTLIFEDGRRIPGAIDKARLEQEFTEAGKG